MKQTSENRGTSEQVVKDIRRATRKQYSAEEKIRIVLDGLRGEYSIAELFRPRRFCEICSAHSYLRCVNAPDIRESVSQRAIDEQRHFENCAFSVL